MKNKIIPFFIIILTTPVIFSMNIKMKWKTTKLYSACGTGQIWLLDQEIQNGANPNDYFKNGRLPLPFAASCLHTETVKALLGYGANPFKKEKSSKKNSYEVTAELVSYYDLNKKYKNLNKACAIRQLLLKNIKNIIQEEDLFDLSGDF